MADRSFTELPPISHPPKNRPWKGLPPGIFAKALPVSKWGQANLAAPSRIALEGIELWFRLRFCLGFLRFCIRKTRMFPNSDNYRWRMSDLATDFLRQKPLAERPAYSGQEFFRQKIADNTGKIRVKKNSNVKIECVNEKPVPRLVRSRAAPNASTWIYNQANTNTYLVWHVLC